MATARQKKKRDKALRHSKPGKIDTSELMPRVAAGLAQGREEIEASDEDYRNSPHAPSGVEMLRRWESENGKTNRVPTPKFIAQNKATGFVRQRPDGTRLADTVLAFPSDVLRSIKEGMICLRCLEPQTHSFADQHIEGCEGVMLHGPSYMKDRQIMDIAMEFEGDKHFGPSKPMTELLDEQEERLEKRKFVKRVLDGGQGRIPREWMQDATLLEGLSDDDKLALARSVG